MSFDYDLNSVKNLINLKSVVATSGASRKKKVLNLSFLNKIVNKKFHNVIKYNSGRSRTGRITVFSKGKSSHRFKLPLLNYKYRSKAISILTSVNANLKSNSITTSIINSTGMYSVIPSALNHNLFLLSLFPSATGRNSYLYNSIIALNSSLRLFDLSGLIASYKQGKHISNMELYPNKGIQYVRSAGSKGIILKSSRVTNSAIIKLPSKVKKVFSVYSLASGDSTPFADKSLISQTSSNKSTRKGLKPRSRGVAKNPVDHPHGGRTKAIRYPRTPWGKTTKFK